MFSGLVPVPGPTVPVTDTMSNLADECLPPTRLNRLRCRLIGHAYYLISFHDEKVYHLQCARCSHLHIIDYR